MTSQPEFTARSSLYDLSKYPQNPGVYLMKDERSRIIYVGKAKNIRKRLGSYFRPPETLPVKTRLMIKRVQRIDAISTLSEKEALLLESSLIKKHRPRYNIVLRDDKQFVLFRLNKSLPYPALELTRKADKSDRGNIYFGPFTSGAAARQTLKVINKLFLLRKCGHKKFRNRVRPCLQYYIKRCLAPCCLEVNADDYRSQVNQVELFLSGKSDQLSQSLRLDMLSASEALNFEKAALIRDQLKAIEQTTKAQSVVIPGGSDLDVFDIVQSRQGLCAGIIFIRQGKVLDNKNFFWPDHEIATPEDTEKLLVTIMSQFYGPDSFIPSKIVLPITLHDDSIQQVLTDFKGENVNIVRARGETMNALLRMARHNSLHHASRISESAGVNLAGVFNLPEEPQIIECIDVSHQSGQNTRIGCVYFEQGKPVKSEYKIYSLPEIPPGDDYKAMKEFIARRSRKENRQWPDILLLDGGVGQLNTVLKALKDNQIQVNFQLAAIAKGPTRSMGQLHDQVFIPGRKNPLSLKPGSPELLFLQKIRDEAHRFVIGSLRKSRSRELRKSDLETISGIGPKRAKALWDYFRDLDLIMNASEDELSRVPGFGPKRAKLVSDELSGMRR